MTKQDHRPAWQRATLAAAGLGAAALSQTASIPAAFAAEAPTSDVSSSSQPTVVDNSTEPPTQESDVSKAARDLEFFVGLMAVGAITAVVIADTAAERRSTRLRSAINSAGYEVSNATSSLTAEIKRSVDAQIAAAAWAEIELVEAQIVVTPDPERRSAPTICLRVENHGAKVMHDLKVNQITISHIMVRGSDGEIRTLNSRIDADVPNRYSPDRGFVEMNLGELAPTATAIESEPQSIERLGTVYSHLSYDGARDGDVIVDCQVAIENYSYRHPLIGAISVNPGSEWQSPSASMRGVAVPPFVGYLSPAAELPTNLGL